MKQTKEKLRQVFENGDKPNQQDFYDWQDSYWHKDERIPKEKIEGIDNVSLNYDLHWSSTNKKLSLIDFKGVTISEISLQTLDNEGTDLRYNTAAATLELYNADNELLDSISVTDFVKNVATQLSINSNTLQLKDSAGNILSTVNFSISNIQGLQTALDGKLNMPTLSNNYIGRWNTTSNNFVNGVIQDDGNRIGIGITPNTTNTSAQLNFKSSDRKVMNIPKTNFISSYSNGQPSQNQQQGDVYNNGDNIFWLRSNSNIDRWKKLTGFDIDYVCKLPQDFNSLKTTYSDTYANPNFDTLDKYGFANIWTSDYCYGQKLTERFTNITNADSRMYEGVLTNINLGIFAYNGAVQQYQDIKGNLFLRGLGYAYTEQDWKKVITDNQNKSTTLGSETNYPSAKLAIDSTNRGFLLPRMTKLQRNAISSPVQGLIIFQTDSGNSGIRVFDGTNWLALQSTID